jgi:hypothetical protein
MLRELADRLAAAPADVAARCDAYIAQSGIDVGPKEQFSQAYRVGGLEHAIGQHVAELKLLVEHYLTQRPSKVRGKK